jgi:hypothetical protein
LSVYEKAVRDLLKDGPKQRKWLIEQLCPRIMSKRKAQSTLNDLVDAKQILVLLKRIEGSYRHETWYCFPKHEYLLDVDAGRAIAAIKRLWSILLRPPIPEEIAVETGIPPEGAEKLAYKFAAQTGWFNPRPELIKASTERLGEVLVCEARIRDAHVREDGDSKSFNYEDDILIVEEAKRLRYLKEHKMFAVLTKDGEFVSWSPEAFKYLQDYKPKYRLSPTLSVVRFG